MKRRLYKLKGHLYKFVGREPSKKEILEHLTYSKPKRKIMEKRREEALDYLVKKYYESKISEEELRKKLESYGRVKRWFYRRSTDLKDVGMIVKESVVKPVGITIMSLSCFFSLILATSTAPKIIRFIDSVVPFPYNVVMGLIVTFPIGFSPIIISPVLYAYYVKKEIKKRLKEEYGIET